MFSIIEYSVTAIVCLLAAVVIQRVYSKEKQQVTDLTAIQGIKWFGWAIFVWGAGALFHLVMKMTFQWDNTNKILIYTGVLISLLNSLFILLCLPSIEHQHKKGIVVQLVERFSTPQFVRVYLSVLAMIGFVFLVTTLNNTGLSNKLIWLIDIPVSIIVAFALLAQLNKAFNSRKMKFMVLPTFALFLLIVVAVSHRMIPEATFSSWFNLQQWELIGVIASLSFKCLLLFLFLILLYSWKFLSEKEQKQTRLEELSIETEHMTKQIEALKLANESHLDTIQTMKTELMHLRETNKIKFSDRQKEVLGNLARFGDEKSYTEIAQDMHISTDGFQTHIYQIKKLLNIRGSKGKELLITFAKENGFSQYSTDNIRSS